MRQYLCSISIAIFLSSAAAAAPAAPESKWVVNMDGAQCVASRSYGTDQNPLFLVLKSPPLGQVIQLAVIRGGTAFDPMQLDGSLAFDGEDRIRFTILAFTPKGQKNRTLLFNLPVKQAALLRSAKLLRVQASSFVTVDFALSAMGSLMKLMDACTGDLRKVWNIAASDDVPTESHIASKGSAPTLVREWPKGDLSRVFSAEDYPTEAVMKHDSGQARFALLVDESGKIADCTIIQTSKVAVLDAQSCALVMRRAKFKPAIGLDGLPAKSAVTQTITWELVGG